MAKKTARQLILYVIGFGVIVAILLAVPEEVQKLVLTSVLTFLLIRFVDREA